MLIHQFVRTYVEDIWTHSTHLSSSPVCVFTVPRHSTGHTRGTRDVDPYPAGLSHITVISDF